MDRKFGETRRLRECLKEAAVYLNGNGFDLYGVIVNGELIRFNGLDDAFAGKGKDQNAENRGEHL
jgi:hypothetical protein